MGQKDVFLSTFAQNIFLQKYSMNQQELWRDTCKRVVDAVTSQYLPADLREEIFQAMLARKFIPGGRYLYSAGRAFHQVNNCFSGETRIVTRYGTRTLAELLGKRAILMTSHGRWAEAEIRSFGVQDLLKVTLSRAGVEKEVFATSGHSWRVAKADAKGRPVGKVEVVTECLSPGDRLWEVYGYGVSRTPLSEAGIQHGIVFGDGNVPKDDFGFNTAHVRLCGEKDAQLLRYFHGYPTRPVDQDTEVSGLPRLFKQKPSMEADRSYLLGWLAGYIAADGCVSSVGKVTISSVKRENLEYVKDVCYLLGIGTYTITQSDRVSNLTNEDSTIFNMTFVRHTLSDDLFLCAEHRKRFVDNPQARNSHWTVKYIDKSNRREEVFCAVVPETHEFVLEDNILTGNCLLMRVEDSREGWAEIMKNTTSALMTGAGIGVEYSLLREKGAVIRKTGGTSTGPLALMNMVNEAGRGIMQGGQRRSAIWAGLKWDHPDIIQFMELKNWSNTLKALKEADPNFPLPMEGTNISVGYDTEFFIAAEDRKHPKYKLAWEVWEKNCLQAFSTAEPGMSFNFCKDSESLRNAPVSAATRVLTQEGYKPVSELVGVKTVVWTGKQWASTVFAKTKENAELVKVVLSNGRSIICDPTHPFIVKKPLEETMERVEAKSLKSNQKLVSDLPPCSNEQYKEDLSSEIRVVSVEKLDYTEDVFCCDVGVEEHSFMAEGVVVSNCTEVTSSDDSDRCNLGTVWIQRCKDRDDFARICHIATVFLLCGGIYSDLPYEKCREIGNKNNRIGVGIGGFHEWMMMRGQGYEVTPELHKWLNAYEQETDSAAYIWSKNLGVQIPKGKRSIAPNGTIGIIAESTTGIEPLICKSYKRRYLKNGVWVHEFVVDATVKRLMEAGVKIEEIEDSFDIPFRERVKFQADVQNYVDQAISSTCNLPSWGSDSNNEKTLEKYSNTLLKYAKRLRGFTCYPDGCRSGQPFTRVTLDEAMAAEGTVFEEKPHECTNGICGL